MSAVLGLQRLPEPHAGATSPIFTTGLHALDSRIGGLARGELWVIASAPGQGRSMLLTQLAGCLAGTHGLVTRFASNRDTAAMVSARLHAAAGLLPLSHLDGRALDSVDRAKLERARARLGDLALEVIDGPFAADRLLDALPARGGTGVDVVCFDDPDWPGRWHLANARTLADRGSAVLLTLERSRVLPGPAYQCDLDQDMGLADVVIEVRHDHLAAAGVDPRDDVPGQAALASLRNRRGPTGSGIALFQSHYARYVDVPSFGPGCSPET